MSHLCPFCRSSQLYPDATEHGMQMVCRNCRARSPVGNHLEDALERLKNIWVTPEAIERAERRERELLTDIVSSTATIMMDSVALAKYAPFRAALEGAKSDAWGYGYASGEAAARPAARHPGAAEAQPKRYDALLAFFEAAAALDAKLASTRQIMAAE